MSFEPACEESAACANAHESSLESSLEGTTTCKCSGRDLPGLEVVDRIRIPADLPPGEWVLGWRWDCEQSTQVWASCSDVTITRPETTYKCRDGQCIVAPGGVSQPNCAAICLPEL